jgi:hypothetical protein
MGEVSRESFHLILKSEEEEWIRSVHPKLKKKTVRAWIFTNNEKDKYYATIRMFDKSNVIGRTSVYQSIGEVLIELYVTINKIYG